MAKIKQKTTLSVEHRGIVLDLPAFADTDRDTEVFETPSGFTAFFTSRPDYDALNEDDGFGKLHSHPRFRHLQAGSPQKYTQLAALIDSEQSGKVAATYLDAYVHSSVQLGLPGFSSCRWDTSHNPIIWEAGECLEPIIEELSKVSRFCRITDVKSDGTATFNLISPLTGVDKQFVSNLFTDCETKKQLASIPTGQFRELPDAFQIALKAVAQCCLLTINAQLVGDGFELYSVDYDFKGNPTIEYENHGVYWGTSFDDAVKDCFDSSKFKVVARVYEQYAYEGERLVHEAVHATHAAIWVANTYSGEEIDNLKVTTLILDSDTWEVA